MWIGFENVNSEEEEAHEARRLTELLWLSITVGLGLPDKFHNSHHKRGDFYSIPLGVTILCEI